ncbi:MAG: NRDE family protein [Alphaproteobacteria bacterium]|nr:NRDE family protein [Alphaproteobacteria bacterium]
MCTVVLLRQPDHPWPIVMAANRDEMQSRPWHPPARHWPDRPDVVAGLDGLAGGSWLGINDHGVVAAILNRTGTLGPQKDKRSRGELTLEALDHADASEAAAALAMLDAGAYRPFNMIIADNRDAFWIANPGGSRAVFVTAIAPGLSMLTAGDLNDPEDPRIRRYLPLFRGAIRPDPSTGDWMAWEALLASRHHEATSDPTGAMCFLLPDGFGTSSSSLIALPSADAVNPVPIWRFAGGEPGTIPFLPVTSFPAPAIHP